MAIWRSQSFLAKAIVNLLVLISPIIFANDELLIMQKDLDPALWAMPLGNYSGHRYSNLEQINRNNVHKLTPVWNFSTGVLRGHQGGPLVIGNIMYVHTPFPNKVFALDLANDGKIIWQYLPDQDPKVAKKMLYDTVNRGLAYGNGKIFVYRADTTLVALDAKTGKIMWKVINGNPKIGQTGTSAPLIAKDKVVVGISGTEYGNRGHLTAYNIETGVREWRAYSMGKDSSVLIKPGKTMHLGQTVDNNISMQSWPEKQWQHGGGATDGWLTYDPTLNLIYYGTGAPMPWNAKQRPGENLWTNAVIARDLDTGVVKWAYQFTPHDQWNYAGTNEMILVELKLKDKMQKCLVHFDRNGFAYTINRETGELLLAEKYQINANWATRIDLATGKPQISAKYSPETNGEDVTTSNICPASLGVKGIQPASYSPKAGLFYVPTANLCMEFEPYRVNFFANNISPYTGASIMMKPADKTTNNLGGLLAWNAMQGKIEWIKSETFAVASGVLTTAGDLVFYGTMDGYIKAIDQKNGKELWKYKAPSGIISNINTYTYDGDQYIAVLSGIGGWPGIGLAADLNNATDGFGAVGVFRQLKNYTELGGVLQVFKLG